MSSETRWRVQITDLETRIMVGIHEHEQKPQRVVVNAEIEGNYPARPQSIGECFNYEIVHQLVTKDWPKKPHADLLETRVVELLEHIFRADKRVTRVRASIAKPDIFLDAKKVGVEAEWTRADFERLSKA